MTDGKRLETAGGVRGPGGPAYLRLERRGDLFLAKFKQGGRGWERVGGPLRLKLPRKVKVGVGVAETTPPGEFKPVFDEFKLTPLKK